MSNLFDNLQQAAYGVVAHSMGYDATWRATGGDQIGRVLFNDPSKKTPLAGVNFQADHFAMEYHAGTFPGLKELVDGGDYSQEIRINGTAYIVRQVTTEYDGKSFVARLELKLTA